MWRNCGGLQYICSTLKITNCVHWFLYFSWGASLLYLFEFLCWTAGHHSTLVQGNISCISRKHGNPKTAKSNWVLSQMPPFLDIVGWWSKKIYMPTTVYSVVNKYLLTYLLMIKSLRNVLCKYLLLLERRNVCSKLYTHTVKVTGMSQSIYRTGHDSW